MGNFKAALGLALGLLGLACQDDGNSSRSEFIKYWADGDSWCEHQACGDLQSKKQCELSWPSAEEIEDAIMLAELGSDQLSKCRTASDAYDDCYFEQSCESFIDASTACPREHDRFQLHCGTVIDALELVPEGGFDDEMVGDGNGVMGNQQFAAAVCDRGFECGAVSPTAADRQDCIEQVSSVLPGVPDPDGFIACIDTMSCSALENGGTQSCLDIDPNNTRCLDADTLSLCNASGQCAMIDCSEVCSDQGLVSDGCAFSPADGYDQCLCSL